MTDFYIAKAGETHSGQKYANVSLAPAGKTYEQGVFTSDIWRWASTYNSPKDTFDTIIYRQLKSTSVGDIVTLKIYKGYVPDLGTSDQPTLPDRQIDENNLMASKSVTMTDTAATDYVFQFDQEFSDVNLTSQLVGDAPQFTVFQETTTSGGTVISAHRTLFADRAVVPEIFTSPEDFGPDSDSGHGGAGNTHYYNETAVFGNSGSAADRPLALEFLKSTDIPLGSDSNDGLSLSAPKATVASVQAIRAFTSADKIIFRGGTYTTELSFGPVSETLIYMEFDTPTEHISLEAYGDETVVFEMPVNESYLLGFTNINGSSNDDVYTVKNIQFRNGASTAVSQSFIYNTQSNSSSTFYKFIVDGCTFTQLGTEIDIVRGGVYAGESNIASVEIRNCEFNIVDQKALTLATQIGAVVENNTFNLVAPTTNDDRLAMFSFSGRQNAVNNQVSQLFFSNNIVNYTFSDGMDGDTIVMQPEYFNEMHFIGNTFNFEATNIQSNRIIDTFRPATTTQAGRTTSLINIIGNTFNNNTGRGDTIEFYRSADFPENTTVVNFNYNTFVGNAEMQNNTSNQVLDTTSMKATEFNCIGNNFEKYQDFILLNDMQNTPFVIEDNVFKNAGNNNTGPAGDNIPLSIYVIESNGGTIKNNTFFIEEEGTCIRLHNGVTNDVKVTGNSFVYLGDARTDGEEYTILNINANDLDEVFIDNNYYYGLEKLGDTTLFAYAPTATFDEAMAIADTDVTFHTTNIIKRDVVKSMTSRMTKEIAWQV